MKKFYLEKEYEKICMKYIFVFEIKQELKFIGWVNNKVGEIALFEDFFFNFTDIKYDIDTRQAPKHIISWYWDNLKYEGVHINYETYTRGLRIEDVKKNDEKIENKIESLRS